MRTLFALLLLLAFNVAQSEPYAWELLNDKEFSRLYRNAITQYQKEHWLTKLSGPSARASRISVGGVEYVYVHSCKTHNCGTNNVVLLYSSVEKALYGLVLEDGVFSYIGNPPIAVQNELRLLHAQRFPMLNMNVQ